MCPYVRTNPKSRQHIFDIFAGLNQTETETTFSFCRPTQRECLASDSGRISLAQSGNESKSGNQAKSGNKSKSGNESKSGNQAKSGNVSEILERVTNIELKPQNGSPF